MRTPILSSYVCEEADGWHWSVWQDDVMIGKGCAPELAVARTQLIQKSIEHLAHGNKIGRVGRQTGTCQLESRSERLPTNGTK